MSPPTHGAAPPSDRTEGASVDTGRARRQQDIAGHTFLNDPPAWALDVLTHKQRQRLPYTQLWRKAINAADLPSTAKLVAHVLATYFGGNEGQKSDPSLERLRDETGMAKSTVSGALKLLDECGFIVRERTRGGNGNRTSYWLTVPDALPTVGEPSATRTVRHANSSAREPQPSATRTPTVRGADTKGSRRDKEGVVRTRAAKSTAKPMSTNTQDHSSNNGQKVKSKSQPRTGTGGVDLDHDRAMRERDDINRRATIEVDRYRTQERAGVDPKDLGTPEEYARRITDRAVGARFLEMMRPAGAPPPAPTSTGHVALSEGSDGVSAFVTAAA